MTEVLSQRGLNRAALARQYLMARVPVPAIDWRRLFSPLHAADATVGMPGFEPGASCSQSRRANQAAPHPARPGSRPAEP